MFWISPHNSSSINSHFTHFPPFFIQPSSTKTQCYYLPLLNDLHFVSVSDFLPIILGIIISQCSLCCIIKAWISLSLKLQGSFIAPFTIKPGNNGRIKIAFSFVGNGLSIFLFFMDSLVLRQVYGSDNGFTQPYSENKFSIFCKIYVSPDPWNKL